VANAKYTAAIQLQVNNLRALDKVESTLKNINAITDRLKKKKLDLYDYGRGGRIGGRGPMRDAVGVASRQATLTIKEFLDGSKNFGKSVNSINSQLGDFNELINMTATEGKGIFNKQRIEVKNLAEVFTQATKRAKELAEAQENLRRTADPTRSGTVVEAEVRNRNRRSRVRRGRERQQRFERARSSALIGGAFPLLFGQGVGAAAGGAAGGFAGGMMKGQMGFALSLVGTNLGSLVDKLVSGAAKLGQALGPFSRNTESVVTSLGLQNSAQAEQIKFIQQTKGETAAFNAAMKFMSNQIGKAGVDSLKRFGENSRLITSSMTLAATKLQAFGASILNFLLRILRAEGALRKADQERTVAFAASRGDEEAQAIQAEQKRINNMEKVDRLVFGSTGLAAPSGGLFPTIYTTKVKSPEAERDQKDLNKRREAFAIGEKERIKMGQINSEQQTLTRTLKEQIALREKTLKFVSQGESQALAEKLARNELINEKATENLQIRKSQIKDQLDGIVEQIKLGKKTEDDKKRLKIEEKTIKELIEGQGKALEDNNKKTRELHDETKKLKITREEIAGLLANETTNAIMGLIEGTKTLSESLAGVARQLASMFLNRAFGSMFDRVFQAEGGYNRAGSFKAFQYGGVVSSPTLGMIGEGGEPEYVIPSSKMSGAMARYSAGARGGAVIPGGSGASGTVAGSSGNTIVEYTGPVLNFNGDEYVPKDSVPQIINAAAKQGATLGQSRTLNTLKNSRSSRAKIGI